MHLFHFLVRGFQSFDMKKNGVVLINYGFGRDAFQAAAFFVCFWAFFSGAFLAFGQTKPAPKAKIDSLYRTLKTAPDTARSRIYLALARTSGVELKKKMEYADTALMWAKRFPEARRLYDAYLLIGSLNKNANNLLAARKAYLKSLEYVDRSDLRLFANVLNNLGEVYARGGEDATAIEYLSQALEKFEAAKDTLGIAFTNNNLGNVYFNRKESQQALAYFEKAKKAYLSLKTKDRNRVNKTIANIAATLEYLKRFDEAMTVYDEALTYLDDSPASRVGKAVVYSNIGHIWELKEDYTKSLAHYEKALALVTPGLDKRFYVMLTYNVGCAYFKLSRYPEAQRWINTGFDVLHNLQDREVIALSTLQSQLDSVAGDYRSAFLHRKRAYSLADSLYGEESLIEFERVSTRFELKREHQADSLQAVKAQQTLIKETQNRDKKQYAGIFVGLLALAALLPLLFRFQAAERFGVVLRIIVALLGFEFLLIVLDPYFTKLSQNVPVVKFGLNVAVAAVFSPLFEYLQSNLEKKKKS